MKQTYKLSREIRAKVQKDHACNCHGGANMTMHFFLSKLGVEFQNWGKNEDRS